jgi:hypothetical protein
MHAPWTLIQASHVVAREFTAVFAEVELTPTQFGVLSSSTVAWDVVQGHSFEHACGQW